MATGIDRRPRAGQRAGLAMLVDVAAGSHRRAAAVLIVLCLLAFLPGFFTTPPVDRDEARFAEATKQMVLTGDYVDIRFQDQARYKKPIGIYWLQAAVVKTADLLQLRRATKVISLYRVPSLLGAIGAVLLTYWAALAFVSRRAAVLAGVMMATSVLLGFEARLAKTDAVLLACCVAAMGALGRGYLAGTDSQRAPANPWIVPAIFWTAMAAGILVKGPVIVLFAVLAVAALAVVDRRIGWLAALRPGLGVLWTILLVLPWFVAITLRSGGDFFAGSLGQDLFSKVGSGQETHGLPPGTYLLLFWVTFFPGAILAGLATPAIWQARREPGAKLLLAWAFPAWIVFEAVATKLPHYVLPIYPALAILIAGVVDHRATSRRPWLVHGTVWWFLITVALAALIIAANVVVEQQMGLIAWPFAAVAVIFALRAWWLYEEDGPERSLLRASAASVLIAMAAFGATVPRLTELFPAKQVGDFLNGVGCTPVVAAAGYNEPSLVFFAGAATQQTDGAGAADFLYPGGCRFAVVERAQERAFVLRADTIGLRYGVATRIDGINLAVGRRISLAVFRAERN